MNGKTKSTKNYSSGSSNPRTKIGAVTRVGAFLDTRRNATKAAADLIGDTTRSIGSMLQGRGPSPVQSSSIPKLEGGGGPGGVASGGGLAESAFRSWRRGQVPAAPQPAVDPSVGTGMVAPSGAATVQNQWGESPSAPAYPAQPVPSQSAILAGAVQSRMQPLPSQPQPIASPVSPAAHADLGAPAPASLPADNPQPATAPIVPLGGPRRSASRSRPRS